jgi:hypothetical protein
MDSPRSSVAFGRVQGRDAATAGWVHKRVKVEEKTIDQRQVCRGWVRKQGDVEEKDDCSAASAGSTARCNRQAASENVPPVKPMKTFPCRLILRSLDGQDWSVALTTTCASADRAAWTMNYYQTLQKACRLHHRRRIWLKNPIDGVVRQAGTQSACGLPGNTSDQTLKGKHGF